MALVNFTGLILNVHTGAVGFAKSYAVYCVLLSLMAIGIGGNLSVIKTFTIYFDIELT